MESLPKADPWKFEDDDLLDLEGALDKLQLHATRSMSKKMEQPQLIKKKSSRIYKDKKEEVKVPTASPKRYLNPPKKPLYEPASRGKSTAPIKRQGWGQAPQKKPIVPPKKAILGS